MLLGAQLTASLETIKKCLVVSKNSGINYGTFLITYDGSIFSMVLMYCSIAPLWSPFA